MGATWNVAIHTWSPQNKEQHRTWLYYHHRIEKDTQEYEFHIEFIPDDRVTLDQDHEQRQIQYLDYLKQRDWNMQKPILYYERSYIVAARIEAHETRMVEIKEHMWTSSRR